MSPKGCAGEFHACFVGFFSFGEIQILHLGCTQASEIEAKIEALRGYQSSKMENRDQEHPLSKMMTKAKDFDKASAKEDCRKYLVDFLALQHCHRIWSAWITIQPNSTYPPTVNRFSDVIESNRPLAGCSVGLQPGRSDVFLHSGRLLIFLGHITHFSILKPLSSRFPPIHQQ